MSELRHGAGWRRCAPFVLFILGLFLGGGCLVAPPQGESDPVCPAVGNVGVELPSELPKGKTVAAGRIEGTLLVTTAGEARYVVPIDVPPGRAGFGPRVAIVHDGGAGDGPLGVGFFLSGISAVTRCARTVARDGVIRGVRFDFDGDAVCLDGIRLVDVGEVEGGRELRTFPDGFVKVIFRGEDGFEARTKDGRVRRFEEIGGAWWVREEEDRSGNPFDDLMIRKG